LGEGTLGQGRDTKERELKGCWKGESSEDEGRKTEGKTIDRDKNPY